jgi:iron complex outermembrane receptor protein
MLALVLLSTARLAEAADQTFNVNIPTEPLRGALVDFAMQTGISLGLKNLDKCTQRPVSLIGHVSVRAGLERILAGSGCRYRQLDTGAFDIVRVQPHPSSRMTVAPRTTPDSDPSPIVVIATQRPTPADRLSYSVSAYSRRTLASDGIEDLSDLALVSPGMTITNLGPARDKILLRGLSDGPFTGEVQSMVGLYLDETRLTYDAPDPDLRLVDIASVEVLRGPQGALYGAGSLGGVVHFVTVQPDPSSFSASIATTVQATQGGAASQALDAVANLPLADGLGAIRAVFYREADGGYLDDRALGIQNTNATLRQGGRLALAFDVNARWTISAGLVEQAIDSADAQYVRAGDPAYSRPNLVLEPHDNDFGEFHVTARGDLGWGQLRWSASEVHHSLFTRYDATSAAPSPTSRGPVAFDETEKINSLVTEATLTAPDTAPVQWLTGVFFAHTKQNTHSTLYPTSAPADLAYVAARRDWRDEAAVFGEAIVPIGSAISMTIGGRVFTAPTAVSSTTSAPAFGQTDSFAGGVRGAGFAPKLVLSYQHSPLALFYIQATEGYRSSGINTLALPGQVFGGPSGSQPYRVFQGDELWNVEAGGKIESPSGRFRMELVGFFDSWKNIQSDQLLPSGLPYTANVGDGQNSGVEFEASYRSGGFELKGEFLANSPELTHPNPTFHSRSDVSLSVVPDLSFGISAHDEWTLDDHWEVDVDGRWTYVGPSRLNLSPGLATKMGDYATGRLAASLGARQWRLTLAVDNPANVYGNTFAYGNPFSLRLGNQATPLRPRTISLTMSASF